MGQHAEEADEPSATRRRCSPAGSALRPDVTMGRHVETYEPPDAAQAPTTSSVRSNLNLRGERKEKEE